MFALRHWERAAPVCIPPAQGKESSVKCETGINHIYTLQETWDTCLETLYLLRAGSVPLAGTGVGVGSGMAQGAVEMQIKLLSAPLTLSCSPTSRWLLE